MNEIDEKKRNRVLSLFKGKTKDCIPKTYRSFSGMRQANGKRTIKLMFGYDSSKNAIYSDAVEIQTLDMFLEVQRLLDLNLDKDVTTYDLFDGLDEEEF